MLKEARLVDSLKKENPEALREVMSAYQDYVFTIVHKLLRNHAEAQEATQDTFIKVYRSIGSFNGQSKFSTWIYRIAYRTGLDYLKKRKPSDSLEDQSIPERYISIDEKAIKRLEKEERSKALERAMGHLKQEDAFLLRLFYFKELTLKEVAEITGMNESNIKVRLFRARKSLKKIMFKDQQTTDEFIH